MKQGTKDTLAIIFYTMALIGIIDMAGQAWTEGEVQIIHTVLSWIFG